MTQRSTSGTSGQAVGPMQTALSADQFQEACKVLVAEHEGHELHLMFDWLVSDLLTSWGYGEGVSVFLTHAMPYHSGAAAGEPVLNGLAEAWPSAAAGGARG